MLDVRKMLYSYKKLEVGLQNIERSIKHLEVIREYPSGVASYSDMPKGSGTTSTTERYAIKNINEQEQTDKRLESLMKDKEAYEEAIQLIRSALSTLTAEQFEYVQFRYFQGMRQVTVSHIMRQTCRTLSRIDQQVIEAINACWNKGNLEIKMKAFQKKQAPTG